MLGDSAAWFVNFSAWGIHTYTGGRWRRKRDNKSRRVRHSFRRRKGRETNTEEERQLVEEKNWNGKRRRRRIAEASEIRRVGRRTE